MLNRLRSFFQNILSRPRLKYVALAGSFFIIFGLVYTFYFFGRVHHRVEIEMMSDHAGVAQLFWSLKRKPFSEGASFRKAVKPGRNRLKFSLPLMAFSEFKELRFDPTEKAGGKIEITGIRYTRDGKHAYQLPLDRFGELQTRGLSPVKVAEGKACMTALDRDPVIIFSKKHLVKCDSSSTRRYVEYAVVCAVAFVFWIILLHGSLTFWNASFPGLGRIVPRLAKAIYFLLFAAFVYFLWRRTDLLGKVTCVLLLLYGIRYLCFREWKKEKKPTVVKSNFDWGMHYFRAVAIACICLGHTFSGAGKEASWGWMFFQADSIYFLFISGYLAQFLFFKKPDPPLVYYKKKVINIILPYLVFSTLILTFLYFTHPRAGLYNRPFTPVDIALAFCFGRAAVAYWYIPFVVVLFLGTPLLVRLSSKNFIRILFIFGAIAIIFPKRGGFSNLEFFLYLYTYFTFSYLLGMAFSRYREPMESFFRKNWLYALLIAIGIGILIGWNPSWNLQISALGLLCSFQKILFTIFFIVLLSFLKDRKIQVLSSLAEFSFTIYFIHLIFYEDYRDIYTVVASYTCLDNVNALVTGCIFLFHMLLLSVLLKKILGKHSRYFIGS